MDAAVVVNEAQFSKFVHEKTHAGPGRAAHRRKAEIDHLVESRFKLLLKFHDQVRMAEASGVDET